MKTTNAKAAAFQTPAPLSASVKTQKASPRLRRAKVKVHQPEALPIDKYDVPEIEYMPPKEVPLLDDMDDYLPRDWKFPMFEAGNATKGIWETYHNPTEDDGRTKLQREFEEGLERDKKTHSTKFDDLFKKQWELDQAEAARYLGAAAPNKTEIKQAPKLVNSTNGPSTLKATSAAAALAKPQRSALPLPTAATKARVASTTISTKKPTIKPSTTQHAAAAAASKSTIGYAQGRGTTTNKATRKPLSNVTKPASYEHAMAHRPFNTSATHTRDISTISLSSKPRGAFSRSSSTSTNATLVAPSHGYEIHPTAEDVEREIGLMMLGDEADGEDAWINSFVTQLNCDDVFNEDLDGFQLQLPVGL